MKGPGVRLQLATRDARRHVSVQLVAHYRQHGYTVCLLVVDGCTVEVRRTHLHSISLFAHTLRAVLGVELQPMASAHWRTAVLPELLGTQHRQRSVA